MPLYSVLFSHLIASDTYLDILITSVIKKKLLNPPEITRILTYILGSVWKYGFKT